jgi:hypothetical protein
LITAERSGFLRADLAPTRRAFLFGDGFAFPTFVSSCRFGGVLSIRSTMRRVASSNSGFFAMTNPWDIPPAPAVGDASEDITFAAVGRALTRWEEFEVLFASLFSTLVGKDDNTAAAIRAYGSVITFRGRADLIRAAAEVHFRLFPNDALAKTFNTFVNQLTNNASPRRNEIAHGIVRPYVSVVDGKTTRTFCLFPPYYAANKNELERIEMRDGGIQITWHTAKYVYSSVEINNFAKSFKELVLPLAGILGPILAAKKGAPISSP